MNHSGISLNLFESRGYSHHVSVGVEKELLSLETVKHEVNEIVEGGTESSVRGEGEGTRTNTCTASVRDIQRIQRLRKEGD